MIPPINQNMILVGGIPTPLKHMKVSWDDEIPNWMESHKIQWNIWKSVGMIKFPTEWKT